MGDIVDLNSFLGQQGVSAWLGYNHLDSEHHEFNSNISPVRVDDLFKYQDPSIKYPLGLCGTDHRKLETTVQCHPAWNKWSPVYPGGECGMLYNGKLADHNCDAVYAYGVCEPKK